MPTNAESAMTRITNQGASLHSYQTLVSARRSFVRMSDPTTPIVPQTTSLNAQRSDRRSCKLATVERDAMHLAPVPGVVVQRVVPHRTVIPEGHRPWLPLEAAGELLLACMVVQAIE